MAARKKFLDRFSEHMDALDQQSRQAYILRLTKERGFFETVIDAVDEGILVIDRSLKIRYHNRAAKDMLSLPDDLRKVRLSQLLQDIDWQQILLHLFNFTILFGALYILLYKPVKDFMAKREEYYSDMTHFNTKEGAQLLANRVIACIEENLDVQATPVDYDKLFAKQTEIIGL